MIIRTGYFTIRPWRALYLALVCVLAVSQFGIMVLIPIAFAVCDLEVTKR